MDMNSFADLLPDRNEQELHSYTKWLAVFGILFGPLLTILGWKYQSPNVSLFDTHGVLMLLLIIDSFQSVLRCHEILEPMWHSISEAFHSLCNWLRQSFPSIWIVSNGSSMPTPNLKEKHVPPATAIDPPSSSHLKYYTFSYRISPQLRSIWLCLCKFRSHGFDLRRKHGFKTCHLL
nr:hypothetical protein CFP56_43464 [Quercus suber]